MKDRPPFPTLLDATMVAAWRACHQKFFREFVQHYKFKAPNVHLHAGKSWAKGLEAARKAYYISGEDESNSITIGMRALMESYGDFVCPPDSAKSLERMMGAFEFYFTRYPMAKDHAIPITLGDQRGIEFSFAETLDDEDGDIVLTPDSGEPILYCGRQDMIADFAGSPHGFDDKTTSSLGASWSKQWDLRSQFIGYTWAARKSGIPVKGTLIRGISILKTKYDTQQAIVYFPKFQIDRWYRQLLIDISNMKTAWSSGYWDYDLSESCNHYGGCAFKQVCLSEDPEPWLKVGFEKRIWNPLDRAETKIDPEEIPS